MNNPNILAKKAKKTVILRMGQTEKDRIVSFENNDVYEVNKRIERIEAKVTLINSSLINNRITRFLFGR